MLNKNSKKTLQEEAASDISMVKSKPFVDFSDKRVIAISVLFIIFFGSLFIQPSNGSKKTEKKPVAHQDALRADRALIANLEKLKTPVVSSKVDQPEEIIKPPHDENYLRRQNAPTSMLSQSPTFLIPPLNIKKDRVAHEKSTNKEKMAAYRMDHPESTIASGEWIHATLDVAIDSSLPGMIRATITEPVYAYIGTHPLIPSGSRLIGQYDSNVQQGQRRVMAMWNKVILPNGIVVSLESPSTDALGRAGQGADVENTHFWKRFGAATLISLMGAGVSSQGVENTDQYHSDSAYRMAIAQSFQQTAQSVLQNSLSIKPTLHLYQGASINVFVAHDLSFYSVLHRENRVG